MSKERTHYGTTPDDVAIGGTVHGQGPLLVFWHGAYGDGDLDWQALLPHLTDRFTCHLPSWRGRGLSGEHPDLSYGRRVDDVLAYVNSLGEPASLVGWSGGASPAIVAAARSNSVNALALVEPTMGTVMEEQERVDFGGAVGRMRELAADANFPEAVRAAAGFPFNEEEVAIAEESGYFAAAGRYVPNLLGVFQQLMDYEGPIADDPAVLEKVSAPMLVLIGSDTKPFWRRSAQHVADHAPNAVAEEIPGAGHAAPLTHTAVLATALAEFIESAAPS